MGNPMWNLITLLSVVCITGCTAGTVQTRPMAMDDESTEGRWQAVSIDISGVFDPLKLPAPEGRNRVLTATVTGDPIRRVWLAQDAASTSRVPLTRTDEDEYQVNIYGRAVFDLLSNQGMDGEFHVFAETADGTIVSSIPVRYALETVPKRLDFPWERASFTAYQRTSRELPGSRGHLSLTLGDITAGHVILSVEGPNSERVIDLTSVGRGDALPLDVGDTRYVLVLDKLVNFLIGRDYAVFSILPATAWEKEQVDSLLKVIEISDATFIRGEQEMTGPQFASHLRLKLEHFGPDVLTADRFIDEIATCSLTTGKHYQIKLVDGDMIEFADWLRRLSTEGGHPEHEAMSDRSTIAGIDEE